MGNVQSWFHTNSTHLYKHFNISGTNLPQQWLNTVNALGGGPSGSKTLSLNVEGNALANLNAKNSPTSSPYATGNSSATMTASQIANIPLEINDLTGIYKAMVADVTPYIAFSGLTPYDSDAQGNPLFPPIKPVIDAANTASGLNFHGSSGDGKLNSDGGDLEAAVSSERANPDSVTIKNVLTTENTYFDRYQYDSPTTDVTSSHGGRQILSPNFQKTKENIRNTVAQNLAHTNYGTLTFSGPVPHEDEYAAGFAYMMSKYGSYMTSGQVAENANDMVTIGPLLGMYAGTVSNVTTINSNAANPPNWSTLAGHETCWDMESSNFGNALTSKYGTHILDQSSDGTYINENTPGWVLSIDLNNYLMRQAVPDTQALSPGEQKISDAIHAGKFTLKDLDQAFFGGDQSATTKIFNAFPVSGTPQNTSSEKAVVIGGPSAIMMP